MRRRRTPWVPARSVNSRTRTSASPRGSRWQGRFHCGSVSDRAVGTLLDSSRMETTDGNDVRRAGAKARVAALRALIRRDGVVRPVRHLVRVIRAEGPRGAWRRARGFFAAAAPESGQRLDGGDCLFVAGCAGGSRVYRCDNQAEQLRLAGQAADVVAYPAVDPMPYAGAYRCFVLQRVPFSKNIAAFIAAAKQNGATVVFDADDLLVHERWLEELGPHVTDDATERAWAIDQM